MNIRNKVSILIPVYNRENLIEETVRSAMNQTYENIEIIIVDNKSTDNTWSVLNKLASQDNRIKIFQNETNIGPVRNWKRCIDEASGEYGKILWSDDLIAPEFLEKTVPFLENEDVGFVFTAVEKFTDIVKKDPANTDFIKQGIYNTNGYIKGVLFSKNYPVSPGCALFRMKDLRKNLLVDIPNKVHSDFSMHAIGNDLLIFLLTASQYKKFAFVDETLSYFREHSNSISIQSEKGKLPLYYALASAFFIENNRTDLIKKFNTKLWWMNIKYKKEAHLYGLNSIEKFYMNNQNYSIDYIFLIKKIIFKIVK